MFFAPPLYLWLEESRPGFSLMFVLAAPSEVLRKQLAAVEEIREFETHLVIIISLNKKLRFQWMKACNHFCEIQVL